MKTQSLINQLNIIGDTRLSEELIELSKTKGSLVITVLEPFSGSYDIKFDVDGSNTKVKYLDTFRKNTSFKIKDVNVLSTCCFIIR